MFATALKDLAVELNIFVMTSTQVNANADDNKNIRNESSIAGSRAVINKADIGCVGARPTNDELSILKDTGLISYGEPNMVTDIYKVRSGEWSQVRIWSHVDLGTLRKHDLFVTNSKMEAIVGDFNDSFDFIVDWTQEIAEKIERIKKSFND